MAGSLRKDSWNRRLLRLAADIAPATMAVRLYDELGTIPLFNEDLETPPPPSVAALRQEVRQADALLIATPEYNWSIPGVLKNAIDWLSRPPDEVLVRKPVAILGASAGRWGTRLAQAALRQVLTATESMVMPSPALFVREARIDDSTRADLQIFLAAFADWIRVRQ